METLVIVVVAVCGVALLGRSAVIAFFPGTGLAVWCEERLGFLDTAGDGDGDSSDGGDGGGGD